MAKEKTIFVCQECGAQSLKWQGRCSECGSWNSFVEEKMIEEPKPTKGLTSRIQSSDDSKTGYGYKALRDVVQDRSNRLATGIGEMDRVLGGGLVPGSLTLISGEPGIGKSTIILQVAFNLSKTLGKVLYVSGEESEVQIKLRANRVCGELNENLLVMGETNMEMIEHTIRQVKPAFLIIDSIQTMYTDTLDSAPGSVSQVRACGNILMSMGKSQNIPTFIVAHVTKSGELAGPKIVEHLVDCVLSFTGERDAELRILRAYKNRFGSTSEIGVFKMEQEGLIEVNDLSDSFIVTDSKAGSEGSVITAIQEGSRPIFIEVQALTSTSTAGFPRRTSVGIDNQRLNMIIAVLEKRCGLKLADKDIYINIVGGIKPDSPSVDLAVALAIFSSYAAISPSCRLLVAGEVGLTGMVGRIQGAEKILSQALRIGYDKVIFGKNTVIKGVKKELEEGIVLRAESLKEALKIFKKLVDN